LERLGLPISPFFTRTYFSEIGNPKYCGKRRTGIEAEAKRAMHLIVARTANE
jgi:hypothetical protein